MIKHKRQAAQSAPKNRIEHAEVETKSRVALVFLVPPALAKAITEAASYSGNLLCKDVIVTDHLILAKPRLSMVEQTILKPDLKPSYTPR
jgi:hypothetical protein